MLAERKKVERKGVKMTDGRRRTAGPTHVLDERNIWPNFQDFLRAFFILGRGLGVPRCTATHPPPVVRVRLVYIIHPFLFNKPVVFVTS